MHTTTVRFPGETWALLKEYCEAEGIPTAQYIREATTARLIGRATAVDAMTAREVRALRARVDKIEQELRRRTR